MDILRKTIIATLPLLLTGCYEDFDPDIDVTPVLCINSLITAGEPIEVNVSRSWVYTDRAGEEDHSVKDAEVNIFANGKRIGPDYLPEEGDVIRIKAYSDKYGAAEAEVMIPYATPVAGMDVNPTVVRRSIRDRDEWGVTVDIDFNVAIDMTLPNNNNSARYFCLADNPFQPGDTDDSEQEYPDENTRWSTSPSGVWFYEGSFYCKGPFFTEHISTFDDMMDNVWLSEPIFFSDHQFSGTSQTLNIGYENGSLRISQWDRNPEMLECGYELTLYSISESYYKWMNYCWQNNESYIGDLIEFGLAEPIWGYSNVSTGAGVVAAQSYVKVTVDLKDFLMHTISESNL